MAKKKKRRRQQGIASWIGSVLGLAVGLSGVADALRVGGLKGLASRATGGITAGRKFALNEALLIYGPILGGVAIKKGFSILAKTARIQSLLPRLG